MPQPVVCGLQRNSDAIGNRRYLDEPSTGMDPLNKRLVWDALLRRKAGRVSEHSY
jgi:hypothetical protein